MGVLFAVSNNISSALKCLRDCLNIRQTLLGSKHGAVGNVLFELGNVQAATGDYSKCIVLYADCLRIRLITDGSDGAGVAKVLLNMGVVHARFGHYCKAMNKSSSSSSMMGTTKLGITKEELIQEESLGLIRDNLSILGQSRIEWMAFGRKLLFAPHL